ncbi:MAG: alkylphosphonate utilization protein [Bdellovibrionales bacterium]|nr:alkylphosphonate utilization protein [Bdellovibrionales bacterium]
MSTEPTCPKCLSENIYADGNIWVCPSCSHEWSQHPYTAKTETSEIAPVGVRDAYGNILSDGDSVTVIKDLKVKGSSAVVKVGTKVKNIRLTDAGDGHDISCKIEGFGAMNLKSEFVKKA